MTRLPLTSSLLATTHPKLTIRRLSLTAARLLPLHTPCITKTITPLTLILIAVATSRPILELWKMSLRPSPRDPESLPSSRLVAMLAYMPLQELQD